MRTFIAIDIPSVDKIAHLQNMIMKQFEFDKFNLRPIAKGNFHLTIKFLGEIDDSEIKDITKNLRGLRFEPFQIRFINAGCFPNSANPRVIWLGLDRPSNEKLNNLYSIISKLLDKIDNRNDKLQNYVAEEKTAFVPHLTIFRPRLPFKIYKPLDPNLLHVSHVDEVKHIKLKNSVLTPDGPIYSDLLIINAV
jgi:2'-5' RNA ligase